tara:strand:- start:1986 stop:2195 length:210 start_codon:yes stop_codon:yes gene_type:complete
MITAYFRHLWYHLNKTRKVYPIEKSPDGTYEHPEQHKKGKRVSLPKPQKTKKFPEENSHSKGQILSIWV